MKAGVQWNHSPNSSSPAAIAELIGGHVDVVCVNSPTFRSSVADGSVRLLAITGDARDTNYGICGQSFEHRNLGRRHCADHLDAA